GRKAAMVPIETRRGFLGSLAGAGATALIRAPLSQAAEGPPETTTVRLQTPGLCAAPVYIAEPMLRAEGSPTSAMMTHPRSARLPRSHLAGSVLPRSMPHHPSERSTPACHAISGRDGRLLRTVREGGHRQHRRTEGKEYRRSNHRVALTTTGDPDGGPGRA